MARRKLSKAQKAKNRAEYNRIRREYNKTDKSITYKQFKARVINRAVGTGESIKVAAKKEANTRQFKDYKTQAKENLLASMKEKFRGTYDELRRKAGRFGKGEHLFDKVEYDNQQDAYVLTSSTGDQYRIDIDDSPQQMYLTKI